eukprot:gnl/MRDRNA2_/MRDRNA2_483889_c0_seq1.p2 gnl/MRDRNA2_/MRDRNA2_483889_c0~~gnl/MRDRNA2_/MRDRNA2_483889_c0_seq1.p2  ORF type:complete len:102 (-),score=10.04 gnl/MRDRNA2_/MRDRNA2_483889_c0_seq1:133-438(-)
MWVKGCNAVSGGMCKVLTPTETSSCSCKRLATVQVRAGIMLTDAGRDSLVKFVLLNICVHIELIEARALLLPVKFVVDMLASLAPVLENAVLEFNSERRRT